MMFPRVEPAAIPVFQYPIASADMYYAELEQRQVFVGNDESGHVRIWGEVANGTPSAKADLCRMFLEYGMYCGSWCSTAEAKYHMERFGEKLGARLASHLQQNPGLVTGKNQATGALECLFGSIGACYSMDHIEHGMRFLVSECPLEEAAKRSGIANVELARHGINAMCKRMMLEIDPGLRVDTSPDSSPQFLFTISEAVAA